MQCRGFRNFGGGGSSGNFRNFKGVLRNFQDPGGWPMSDNDIFQGVQTPDDTMVPVTSVFSDKLGKICEFTCHKDEISFLSK